MEITGSQYKEFKQSVVNEINRIIEEDADTFVDEHKAFDLFAFEYFSDAPQDSFVLTDGVNRQGK